jgi:maleate isomerase
VESGHPAPVVTSAGALIEGLKALGSRRTAIIRPDMRPLTNRVVSHIENEGIAVQDSIAFEIPDNLDVAAQDPKNLLEHVRLLDLSGVDTIKLSGCVRTH